MSGDESVSFLFSNYKYITLLILSYIHVIMSTPLFASCEFRCEKSNYHITQFGEIFSFLEERQAPFTLFCSPIFLLQFLWGRQGESSYRDYSRMHGVCLCVRICPTLRVKVSQPLHRAERGFPAATLGAALRAFPSEYLLAGGQNFYLFCVAVLIFLPQLCHFCVFYICLYCSLPGLGFNFPASSRPE